MIEAAVLLYRHTGKKGYLREAERVAESGYRHFFNGERDWMRRVVSVC